MELWVCTLETRTTAVTRTRGITHAPRLTQRGGGVTRGFGEGEREISSTLETDFVHPFKTGKGRGKARGGLSLT